MLFITTALNNFRYAFIGASLWSCLWFIAFYVSNMVIEQFGGSAQDVTTITALALTSAVIAGHFAKLASYLGGCDTDFRHIGMSSKTHSEQPRINRFFLSLICIITAGFFLWENLAEANKTVQIVNSEFFGYSISFLKVILCLYCAQIIFSWPDPEGPQR